MKFIFIVLMFGLINSVFGSNPGQGYGCSMNGQGSYLYTNWGQTDSSAPGNSGWTGTFQVYLSGPANYNYLIDYNGASGSCGIINPNIVTLSTQGTCFVRLGGVWTQGNLVSFNQSAISSCSAPDATLPLDDYIPLFILIFGAFGFYYLSKRGSLLVA